MEKEKRLLYFFLLMINGEKINRSELIRKTMKTSRTIRRDMDAFSLIEKWFNIDFNVATSSALPFEMS